MKMYKLFFIISIIIIFKISLLFGVGLTVSVTDLTTSGQGTIPKGSVWLFAVSIVNNETGPITVDTVTISFTGTLNFSDCFDTLGADVDEFVDTVPFAINGDVEIVPSGSTNNLGPLNLGIAENSTGYLSIYVILSDKANISTTQLLRYFRATFVRIYYSFGGITNTFVPAYPQPKTAAVATEWKVNKTTTSSGDILGAQSGPFPIFKIGAAASNGEKLSSLTLLFHPVNGKFIPGGSKYDQFGDLYEVAIYYDKNRDGKFNPDEDQKLKSKGRSSLPTVIDISDSQNPTINGVEITVNDIPYYKVDITGINHYIPMDYSLNSEYFITITTNQGWGNPDIPDLPNANYVGFGDIFYVEIPETGIKIVPYERTNLLWTHSKSVKSDSISLVTCIQNHNIELEPYQGYDVSDALISSPFYKVNDGQDLDFVPNFMFFVPLLGGPSTVSPKTALTKIDLYVQSIQEFDPTRDLRPITNDLLSGISVWYNKSDKKYFSYNDELIPLSPNYSRWELVDSSNNIWKISLEFENGFILPYYDGSLNGDVSDSETEEGLVSEENEEAEGNDLIGAKYKPAGWRALTHKEGLWIMFLMSDKYNFGAQFNAWIPDSGLYFSGGMQSNWYDNMNGIYVANPPVIFYDQVTNNEVTKLSEPFSVVGLNCWSGGANLNLSMLDFMLERPNDRPDSFTAEDLRELTADKYSGIAIYKDNDNDSRNTNGQFDPDIDILIPLEFTPNGDGYIGSTKNMFWGINHPGVHLLLEDTTAAIIPVDDEGQNAGADFFIVFRTSATADNGDKFRVAFGDPIVLDGIDPKIYIYDNDSHVYYQVFSGYDADAATRFYSSWITISSVTALKIEDLTYQSQIVDAGSDYIPIFGLNIKDGDGGIQKINSIKIHCSDSSVIAELTTNKNSGIQIWYDVNNNGIFEKEIDEIQTVIAPYWIDDTTAFFTFATPLDIEDVDEGFIDYFIIIKTSTDAKMGTEFQISIEGGDIEFQYGQSDTDVYDTSYILTIGVPVIFSDLTEVEQKFSTSNSPLAIIGINVNSNYNDEIYFKELRIVFKDTGTINFNKWDLAELTGDTDGGVCLWRDANGNGLFEASTDSPIRFEIGGIRWFGPDTDGFPITFNFDLVKAEDRNLIYLPLNDTGLNKGNDYFITINPGRQIDFGDDFYAEIKVNSVKFSVGGVIGNNISTKKIIGNVINNTELTNLVTEGFRMPANSEITPIIKITVNDGEGATETFDGITLEFENNFNLSYLAPLSNSDTSGIQFWVDVNFDGQFDTMIDQRIPLKESAIPTEIINNQLTFTFESGQDISDTPARKSNFFVCIKTDTNIIYGETFVVMIPINGVRYSSNTAKESIRTNEIKFKVPLEFENLITSHTYVKADTTIPIPIIGIKVYDNKETGVQIQNITIKFKEKQGSIMQQDFAPLTNDTYSGVSLWVDSDSDGIFNINTDRLVVLSKVPSWSVSGLEVTLTPDTLEVPDINNNKNRFFIVVRITSDTRYWQGLNVNKTTNDAFSFYIEKGSITFYEEEDNKTIQSDVGIYNDSFWMIADTLKPGIIKDGFVSYSDSTWQIKADTVYKQGENFYFTVEYYEEVDTPIIDLKEINGYFNYATDIAGGTLVITPDATYMKWYIIYKNSADTLAGNYYGNLKISATDKVGNIGDTEYYQLEIDNIPPIITSVYIDTTVAYGSDTIFKANDSIVIIINFDPVDDTNSILLYTDLDLKDSDYSSDRFSYENVTTNQIKATYTFSSNKNYSTPVGTYDTITIILSDGANDTTAYVNLYIDNNPPTINIGENFIIRTQKYITPTTYSMVENDTFVKQNEMIEIYYNPAEDPGETITVEFSFDILGTDTIIKQGSSINSIEFSFTTGSKINLNDGDVFIPIKLSDKAGNDTTMYLNLYLDISSPYVKIDSINDTIIEILPYTFTGVSYDVDGDSILIGDQSSKIDTVFIKIEVDTITKNGANFISQGIFNATNTSSETYYQTFSYTLASSYGEGLYRISAIALDKAGNTMTDSITIDFRTLYDIKKSDYIDILSDPTPIIGLAITGPAGQTLDAIRLNFISVSGGTFTKSDLLPINSTPMSGILVYKDNGLINGEFDEGDSIVSLADGISWQTDTIIKLVFRNNEYVNTDNTGANKGIDYFIALRTSSTLTAGKQFNVAINSGDIEFNNASNLSSIIAGPLTANPYVSYTNLLSETTYLYTNGNTIPVIKIDFADNGNNYTLQKLVVSFLNVNNFTKDDLLSLSENGVCLIVDKNNNDTLDVNDLFIPVNLSKSWTGSDKYYFIELELSEAFPLPDTIGDSSIFLCIRTSNSITYNDAFKVKIFGESITLSTGYIQKDITTGTIINRADKTPPELNIISPPMYSVLSNYSDQSIANVDIVFLIDFTASMAGTINNVKNNVGKLAAGLQSAGINAYFGLTKFNDKGYTDTDVVYFYGMTSSVDQLKSWLATIQAENGGAEDEMGLEAIHLTLDTAPFRTGVKKFFVIITDNKLADIDGDPDYAQYSYLETAERMKLENVICFAIGYFGQSSIYDEMLPLVTITGGDTAYIEGNYSEIMEKIKTKIIESIYKRATDIIGTAQDDGIGIQSIKIFWQTSEGWSDTYNAISTDSFATWSFKIVNQGINDGPCTIYIVATDYSNNTTIDSIIISFDNQPPTISLDKVMEDAAVGTYRLYGEIATTPSPYSSIYGNTTGVYIVQYSIDNGNIWNNAIFASDGVDNDGDGLIDEEECDEKNDDWQTHSIEKGDYWADDPEGTEGKFDFLIDEIFLADVYNTVPYYIYSGNNVIISEGKTSGVNIYQNTRIFPLIDEDIIDTNIYDDKVKFVCFIKPAKYSENLKIIIRVFDGAGNKNEIDTTIKLGPAFKVELTDLTTTDTTIDVNKNIPIFKINIIDNYNSNLNLTELTLKFHNKSSFKSEWLENIGNYDTSGIAIYMEDTSSTKGGVFDESDMRVAIASNLYFTSEGNDSVINIPIIGQYPIMGLPNGTNFYVVIRTSNQINVGDSFTISIPTNGINLSGRTATESISTDTLYSNIYLQITDLTYDTQYSYANSYIPLFGINTFSKNSSIKLNTLKVSFEQTTGFSQNDLSSRLLSDSRAGITLWKKRSAEEVLFDINTDSFIKAFNRWDFYNAYFDNLNLTLPDSDVYNNIDYIIVLKTSADISAGDKIQAYLDTYSFSFSNSIYNIDNLYEKSSLIIITDTNAIDTSTKFYSKITSFINEQVIIDTYVIVEGEALTDKGEIIGIELWIDTGTGNKIVAKPYYNKGTQRWYYYYEFKGDTADYYISSRALNNNGYFSQMNDTILIKYRPYATDIIKPIITNVYAIPNPFSPNGDGYEDTASLYFELIENDEGATVTITIYPINVTLGETIVLTSQWYKSGVDSYVINRNNLSEGEYLLRLYAVDRTGNRSKEASISLIINIAGPTISDIFVKPNPFTPNGDGINDKVEIQFKISDLETPFYIGHYRIYDADDSGSNVVMRGGWFAGPNQFSYPTKIALIKEFQTVFDVNVQAIGTDMNGNYITTQEIITIKATDEVGKRYPINTVFSSLTGFSFIASGSGMNNNVMIFRVESDPGFQLNVTILDKDEKIIKTLSTTPIFNGNGIYKAIWDPGTIADGQYKYLIKVVDGANNVSQYKGIIIAGSVVEEPGGGVISDTIPPTSYLTFPVAGQTYTISSETQVLLRGEAWDNNDSPLDFSSAYTKLKIIMSYTYKGQTYSNEYLVSSADYDTETKKFTYLWTVPTFLSGKEIEFEFYSQAIDAFNNAQAEIEEKAIIKVDKANVTVLTITSPTNNYEVKPGEFRLNVVVEASGEAEKQKKIILYRNNVKFRETPDDWEGGSSYTFQNVELDFNSSKTQFYVIGIDEYNNISDSSAVVNIYYNKIVAVGISGKTDNQPSFNPTIPGQTLKVLVPDGTNFAEMRIYTLKGELVKVVKWNSSADYLEWAGRNDASSLVKNGVYLVKLKVVSPTINIDKTFPIVVMK
ncbi:MAG TPA: VWA domain-containing protein [bacterium]|mgnify:CR=1 FL=1|nr:VWA domain-containing protein [bacterium]